LTKSEKSGFIIVDENKCIGCGWCIRACDFGVLTLHPDKKVAIVCDLCDGDPQCVKYCELDALEYTTFEKLAEKTRRSILMTKILETAQSRGVMQSLTMTGKPCKAYDSSKQNNSIMQTYAQWQPKQPSYPYAQQ
jgi:Fe-S-cluster-containing dehydrogenase component